jgi:flagellar hook-associated protein 2
MTDISTGTLAQSGTTTFVVGTSSGLDTSALVDNAVAQETRKADVIDIQVDENDAKVAAYTELETLAQDLQSSLDVLKSPQGFLSDDQSVFDTRAGFISASDGTDGSSYIGVAVDDNAAVGSYNIEVLQTAEAMKVSGNSIADSAADLGYTGSFVIGLDGMSNVQIDVTADMSLDDLAASINAQSDSSGVEASILKVSETEYQLILTGQNTAQNIQASFVSGSGDDVLNLIGITDGAGGFNNIIQTAQEAIIELDGTTITRNDNEFDDLIDGVEISLRNADPGTIITLDVDRDAQAVKDAIIGFVESYNALRDYIVQNQQVGSDGTISEDAVLFSDNIMDSLSSDIMGIIGSDFSDSASVQTIRDLGLNFDDDNRLIIADEADLDSVIVNDFDDVEAFFSSGFSSDNNEFALISNTSNAPTQNITFDIVVDGSGNITSVSANGDSNAFDFNGTSITGKAGTVYEGMTFSYQGSTSVTVNTSLSQGMADQLYNNIAVYANDIDGLIVTEKAALQEENEDLSIEAEEIRTNAEVVREREIIKYAEMEAEIERLKILQNQIRAILGADSDD